MMQDGFQYGEWEMRHKQKKLLREAEVSRQAKQADSGAEGDQRFSHWVVARLGDWLVEWGTRLQAHSGNALSASGSPSRAG